MFVRRIGDVEGRSEESGYDYIGLGSEGPAAPHSDDPVSAHTPGPWEVRIQDAGVHVTLRDSTGVKFAVVIQGPRTAGKHENARLIAAAPDLLEALERVAEDDFAHDTHEIVLAAIAKAKGEAQ